uniref:Uncharacterized protein n=1 Tax=Phaeomonas parva TaxID=124430 RepID=A0A7S1UDU1_9STRA|mmetsp:Transcript_42584/g.133492  ORF Transcript_42584/g.133492 Transcript_42584/m.133492 type:complete len:142 (+) Transcript_42584:142-567(+)
MALCGFLRLRIGTAAGLCPRRVRLDEEPRETTIEVDTTLATAREDVGSALAEPASPEEAVFPELRGAALVRELHVYGQLSAALMNADQKDIAKNIPTPNPNPDPNPNPNPNGNPNPNPNPDPYPNPSRNPSLLVSVSVRVV